MRTPAVPRAPLIRAIRAAALTLPLALGAQSAGTAAKRPMTFLDAQLMRQVQSPALSRDGKWMLYALSVPNWKEAKKYTDIYLVNTGQGVPSTRQLTFTKDKNETQPKWSVDGSFFVFASNRDAPADKSGTNQLYRMRPDGGEAVKITDAKDGVGTFDFSPDGRWLIFAAGRNDEQQLWAIDVARIDSATPAPVYAHATPVKSWQFSKDGKKVYFLSPDSVDKDNKERIEKKFDVKVRNQDLPLDHLWELDLAARTEKRLTQSNDFSVDDFSLSNDGKWAGLRALPNDRYQRTIMESFNSGDLYLLDLQTGNLERLTTNKDIAESDLEFSPDGKTIAFSASDDFAYFRANRVYVRPIDAIGGQWKKLGASYDGDIGIGWWSDDSKTIYFADGVKASTQLLALDLEKNTVTQLTNEKAVFFPTKDEPSGRLLVSYTDPKTPNTWYIVNGANAADRSTWKQLTDPNPQVAGLLLGDEEEISWKSKDGKTVYGILVKPVNYEPGKRYPLIVAIHGGPQAADMLQFNGGYGSQVYAGDGYAVLMPNYRGSTNYGEKHKWDIVGNYFQKGYEDIMTGVDHLIATGVVDGDRMGALGWSAGGHWSNWILTHTDRFKAISSGAGTMNWISMYAQSDMQYVRMNYLGGKLPYENFDAYWNQSPLKYIRNAKTPTMIHVVDGDPRVPRPQSEELHMALKKLGVPTEFFVYPGTTHGIPDPRNQLLKGVAEKAWMDHYILGKGGFRWRDVLKTLEEKESASVTTSSGSR